MSKVIRTDLLAHAMNPGKEQKVRELLRAWRKCAPRIASEQWRLFYEVGTFKNMYRSSRESGYKEVVGSAARVQMVRRQIVGQLESFMSNRQNDYSRIVNRSQLHNEVKHQLNYINRWQAWFGREPLSMKDGTPISDNVRVLARQIMRHVLSRHRKPSMSRINMTIDSREAEVRTPKKSSKAYLWIRLSTMHKGERIEIPLRRHNNFDARQGKQVNSIQIVDKGGRLYFGLGTDITEACDSQKSGYVARVDGLALDYGLRTLFASNRGDLLGRDFLEKLRYYDARITRLAKYRQSHGLKTRSPRYDKEVRKLRGYLKTEINRVLNTLVRTQKPGCIIVEKLNFRNGGLSRRMNRLVTNAGRAIIDEKLQDLHDRLGIEICEVNPAYSSQECSRCHYVDKKNRTRDRFRCLWCGHTSHADVNAAKSLESRRSRPEVGSVKLTKDAVLRALVLDFQRQNMERWGNPKGRRGTPRDPRPTNPYF